MVLFGLDCCVEWGVGDAKLSSPQGSGFRGFCGFNTISSKSTNTIVEDLGLMVLFLLHSHLSLGLPECFTFQGLV